MSNRKIVIIGNGVSGITCARHIRKADEHAEIIVISGETQYFYSRTALMYVYMGHMNFEHTKPYEDWFWEKNNINLLQAWVEVIDFQKQELICHDGKSIHYDELIIASGSKPIIGRWKGNDLKGVQGLYSYQDLEKMEENTKSIESAVVVGGGLIGIEMAEMLLSRNIKVTFIVREENYWDNVLPREEAQLINRHIQEHGVTLKLSTELKEIFSDDEGSVCAVSTSKDEKIDCEFVGIAIGVSPNIDFLKDTPLQLGRGILVDKYFRTNIPKVYAIGDCAEFSTSPGINRKSIEQVWYTGRMQGQVLAQNLTSKDARPYSPGIWFNSAKFFDIEYQTYGHIPPVLPNNTATFYWEDRSGKIAIRFNYEKDSEILLGVNAFGWRLRHAFFDKAISESWTIERVMGSLDKASFNPEFFKTIHYDVLQAYNSQMGRDIRFEKLSFFQKLIGTRR